MWALEPTQQIFYDMKLKCGQMYMDGNLIEAGVAKPEIISWGANLRKYKNDHIRKNTHIVEIRKKTERMKNTLYIQRCVSSVQWPIIL